MNNRKPDTMLQALRAYATTSQAATHNLPTNS